MCVCSKFTITKKEDICCLEGLGNAIDYKLPTVVKMKKRHPAHRLTPDSINKYNEAIRRMKSLDGNDPRSFKQQANIHCAYCNAAYRTIGSDGKKQDLQVHFSWLFFPFHRWYLYFFERILGELIHDPDFALPFWNWDNPDGGMTIPNIFLDSKSALFDEFRDPKSTSDGAVVDLDSPAKQRDRPSDTTPYFLKKNNLRILHTEMITGHSNANGFMGEPHGHGELFVGGSLEAGSHTGVHVWVGTKGKHSTGENMGNFYSAARDPLFYSHHGNVDRMWTLWQSGLPNNPVKDKDRMIENPDFLKSEFLFYDEKRQLVRVTVEDCLDNRKMGYEYEDVDITSWLCYRPPGQKKAAKVKRAGMSVEKAETVFPLTLEKAVRIKVPKAKTGNVDEILVIENVTVVDTGKFIKFDVFVNDEDDEVSDDLDKASYAGSYSQAPHLSSETDRTMTIASIPFRLTHLYEYMDVDDDDTVLVTLVPKHEEPGLVSIGGIKIIETPTN